MPDIHHPTDEVEKSFISLLHVLENSFQERFTSSISSMCVNEFSIYSFYMDIFKTLKSISLSYSDFLEKEYCRAKSIELISTSSK